MVVVLLVSVKIYFVASGQEIVLPQGLENEKWEWRWVPATLLQTSGMEEAHVFEHAC